MVVCGPYDVVSKHALNWLSNSLCEILSGLDYTFFSFGVLYKNSIFHMSFYKVVFWLLGAV